MAAQMGSFWPILLMWVAGGFYALLGATSLAELATAMPQAGGFYVYSKRAFGAPAGFAVGWADWLNNCSVVAYGAVAAARPPFYPRGAVTAGGVLYRALERIAGK
jgi:APA family basic amino acid/polyamine antiporter